MVQSRWCTEYYQETICISLFSYYNFKAARLGGFFLPVKEVKF